MYRICAPDGDRFEGLAAVFYKPAVDCLDQVAYHVL
jgi:hypothetical protein